MTATSPTANCHNLNPPHDQLSTTASLTRQTPQQQPPSSTSPTANHHITNCQPPHQQPLTIDSATAKHHITNCEAIHHQPPATPSATANHRFSNRQPPHQEVPSTAAPTTNHHTSNHLVSYHETTTTRSATSNHITKCQAPKHQPPTTTSAGPNITKPLPPHHHTTVGGFGRSHRGKGYWGGQHAHGTREISARATREYEGTKRGRGLRGRPFSKQSGKGWASRQR